ncbi:KPN_02809 family neutral zinc metallopeptidase [Alcaligenes sp. SDU_A2]|uniref:KPN_02809 family neutral zinc metallopeptidase n=1 Tax=Alcaligenes sp. SDU_A2 TaxID=3136634 RepID=UPI0031205557
MRLDRSRSSRNVEDRRAAGPRGGRGKIGLGAIVLALVAMYFGLDPTMVLNLAQGPVTQPPAQSVPANDAQGQYIAKVLGETEDVWRAIFQQQTTGQYRDPVLVLYRGATPTACGTGQSAMGPFYCPGDEKLYIDLGFFDEMERSMGVKGDFAPAYVIAHEVGHHVQNQLGAMRTLEQARRSGSQSRANQASVRLELQADCYAGVWAHHADAQRQILEPGDIQEALAAAQAVGDDTLQKQAQGYVVPDSFTHGSAKQRMAWFQQGYRSGQLQRCDTFNQADPS